MNTMQRAHQWAREHRADYASYRDALAEGLRVMHHRAQAQARGLETRQLWRERMEARMQSVQKAPLLLRDWKALGYEGRKDYRAWMQ